MPLNRAGAATLALALCAAFASPLPAQEAAASWSDLAAAETAANSQPGPRQEPARSLPVPREGVSPQERAVIANPYVGYWNAAPKDAAAWKELVAKAAAPVLAALPAIRDKLGVTSEPVTIAGVKAFIVQPRVVPAVNRDRLLLHVHGGGYVLSPGEAGTREAVLMAGYGGFRVVSVDYRMPPDAPYPAALDDAMAVYRDLLKTNDPRHVAIFGTSTGGGMTLAMVLRAKDEGLPLPAAIAPGTPWADLTETGDSYFANEFADNVLVSWKGWLGRAALLYAGGWDLKLPYLSPVYGDFTGFPPAILTSGTRDLFLSNTVRVHRKLRQAGVEAVLQVFEGQSHAQYYADPFGPETLEYHGEVARFLDAHLAR
jgi:acetyl esterase/lipase